MSKLSLVISIVSISLDDLDKNFDAAKSGLKSLDFKNLDREKKIRSSHFNKVGLDTKDSLDLDLDWSQLSRPSGFVKAFRNIHLPSNWALAFNNRSKPANKVIKKLQQFVPWRVL